MYFLRADLFNNMVSISVLLFILLPLIIFLISNYTQFLYLWIFILSLFVCATTAIFKRLICWFSTHPALYRPNNGNCCSIFNKPQDSVLEPAFPSGHMSTATFVATCLLLNIIKNVQPFIIQLVLSTMLILYVFLIGYSRYYKQCHNVLQICGGFIYGLITAASFCTIYIYI